MPTITIAFSEQEMFESGIAQLRDMSDKLLKLSDLNQVPLAPGETPDQRRHLLAKLGKHLAEAFIAFDEFMREARDSRKPPKDVTADAPTNLDMKPDPNAN